MDREVVIVDVDQGQGVNGEQHRSSCKPAEFQSIRLRRSQVRTPVINDNISTITASLHLLRSPLTPIAPSNKTSLCDPPFHLHLLAEPTISSFLCVCVKKSSS
eukprot:scaffold367_cov202-Alexandrium_tamarense.AAC.1